MKSVLFIFLGIIGGLIGFVAMLFFTGFIWEILMPWIMSIYH